MKFKNTLVTMLVLTFCLLGSVLINSAQTLPTGKLKTRNNKQVTLNGNKAASGTTILSGAQIQTPEKVGATVEINGLGRLDMAPQVDVKIEFVAGQIIVELKSGYVVLTTAKGVKGFVKMPDGKTIELDGTKQSSVIARTEGSIGPEASAPVGAAGGIGAGGAAAGAAAAGGTVVGGAAASKSKRGKDVSPSTPRP